MTIFTRSLFATSLLLCSLLVIVSANDYSNDLSKTQAAYDYARKPEGEEKPDYATKPTPKVEEKPEYGTKTEFYKSVGLEDYKEKSNYDTKQVYQPQTSNPELKKEEKPEYGTKKNFYEPQPEEKEKPKPEEDEKPDYGTKPEGEENPDHYEFPDLYSAKPEVLPIGVQGLVLCKSGPNYYPIQGTLARITCLAVDKNGYKKPHSVCSGKTDAKGYFFATLSDPLSLDKDDQLTKLTECKAFLESSPSETCNVPVDVNRGISGAPLSDFRVLDQKRLKLYSVGPFFFTSEPNSVPNGY